MFFKSSYLFFKWGVLATVPCMARRTYRQYCALARALDVVGERWTLLLVRELCAGPRRYGELQAGLPGIGTNLLAARLKQLEEDGVVQRARAGEAIGTAYQLTERGRELEPIVEALGAWGLDRLGARTEDDRFVASWLPMALRIRFRPDRAVGVHETYEYVVDGEAFEVRVDGAELTVTRGPAADPAFSLTTDAAALAELAAGTLTPAQALDSGRWRLRGSEASLARSFELFPPDGP